MKNSNGSNVDLIKGLNDIPDRKQNAAPKNNNRRKPKKKLLVLIVAGLLLLLILIAVGGYGYHKASMFLRQSKLRSNYMETISSYTVDDPIPEKVVISEWSPASLVIPAIGIDLICIGDVDVFDPESLAKGPTHFNDLTSMGLDVLGDLPNTEKGNVAFAGMWYFFDGIVNLEEGDDIYLDIAGYRFIYQVIWSEELGKYDWSAIETTDYPSITLQTSYPIHYSAPNPDYRLYVRGELIEVVKIPDKIK